MKKVLIVCVSKPLAELAPIEYDLVATRGCGDACPMMRASVREDWDIPGPKNMEPEEFRKMRDLIESKVKAALLRFGIDLCQTTAPSH